MGVQQDSDYASTKASDGSAILTSSIADGDTTHAPDGNSVFDALALKAPLASPTFTGTVGGITKAMVGLGSVDNTSDAGKPVSTAQQAALDLKLNIARTVVPTSAASVAPTLVDSGKQYRMTNAAPTFVLPANPVPGSTVFYVQGVGGDWDIDGSTNNQTIEWVGIETGALAGHSTFNISGVLQYSACELRCVATDTWAMTGTIAPFS